MINFQGLNKFHKINLEKNDLYSYIQQNKNLLEDYHIKIKVKSDMDLFLLEIITRSLYNKWAIDNAYREFVGEYYDTFNYINYEEKRLMFINDIQDLLVKLPHFSYHDQPIYIPHFDETINNWYVNDYGIMTLKQHKEYIDHYQFNVLQPQTLYGPLFNTDFSSLLKILEDEDYYYYYLETLHTLYIFDKDYQIINKVILTSMKYNEVIEESLLKQLIECIQQEDEKTFYTLLLDHELINNKIYKKLTKKLKG